LLGVMAFAGMELLAADEKAAFEFAGRIAGGLEYAGVLHMREQIASLGGDLLPWFVGSGERVQFKPERAVDERVLRVDEFCEDDIGVLRQPTEYAEDLAAGRMRPPGSAHRLARDDGRHARQFGVGLEQQSGAPQFVENYVQSSFTGP